MERTPCSRPGCDRDAVAKGLCRSHYNHSRTKARKAAEQPSERACLVCGRPFAVDDPRRVFCSSGCKYRSENRTRQARRLAARAPRACRSCGTGFPAVGRSVYCSDACRTAGIRRAARTRKQDVNWAKVGPCKVCGGVIPRERTARAVYCSDECQAKAAAEWRRRNTPDYMRRRLYGLEPGRYDAMVADQGGRCAICRTDAPGGKGDWHVDHDHATGRVRGLLCNRCNLLLGHAQDDPQRLRAAIAYLSR